MHMIIVYVLLGSSKRYVGITNNLEKRLAEHKSRRTKGGQIIGDSFRVILKEQYPDYKTARIREKFLKSGQGRKWLDKLENGTRSAQGG